MPRTVEALKSLVEDSSLYTLVSDYRRSRGQAKQRAAWERAGRPNPPPHSVKQEIVREYGTRHRLDVLIETGTYLGDMVFAMRNTFGTIHSIELGEELYVRAKKRFAAYPHVSIHHGDSGVVLSEILGRISEPCLFWLDGHFSAGFTAKGPLETPIIQELSHIAAHPLASEHVILIDDARCFDGTGDYPTIEFLRDYLAGAGYRNFDNQNDIVRATR